MNQVVPIEKPRGSDLRVVQDRIAVFDTANFEHMQRIATLMATCALVPDALKGKVADCFLVVNQARNWNMDPFSVAQCTSVVSGKLCFEGKLIAAAIASDAALEGPLNYLYSGSGDARKIVVSGKLKGEAEPRVIEGTVGGWKTTNKQWQADPDQMLAYRGARQWARRHKADRLLGVYAQDEIEDDAGEKWPRREPRDITPPSPPPAPVDAAAPSAPVAKSEVIPPEAPTEPVSTMSYDEKIVDWTEGLKAADRNTQEEIFEEIEASREAGEIFPPDYNKLIGLIKDA